MPAALVQYGEHGDFLAYQVPPAIYRRALVDERPWPSVGAAGTGGLETARFYLRKLGYPVFEVEKQPKDSLATVSFVELMQAIKQGFGRTFSHLPSVFGVSRQTLYNWASGEMPREVHHARLRQLAAAARVFSSANFKPSAVALDRTIANGRGMLQLLAEGGDGDAIAKELVRLVQRGASARSRLDAILAGGVPSRNSYGTSLEGDNQGNGTAMDT